MGFDEFNKADVKRDRAGKFSSGSRGGVVPPSRWERTEGEKRSDLKGRAKKTGRAAFEAEFHITQTEREALRAVLDEHQRTGGVKFRVGRKTYDIDPVGKTVAVTTPMRDDWGKPKLHKSRVFFEMPNGANDMTGLNMEKQIAQDAPQWITVHPNGRGNKGSPVLIESTSGEILGGMGGKFNGGTISDIHLTRLLEHMSGVSKPRKPKSQTIKGGLSKTGQAMYREFMKLSRADVKKPAKAKAKAKKTVNRKASRRKGRDSMAMDSFSKRRFDENGFMHVDSNHITKEQIAPYRGNEIPGWETMGLDPDKIYYGYRPADELRRALETFNGLPIMLRHHTVSAETPMKDFQVGSMATNAVWNAPYVDNGLVFTDAMGIDAVKSGRCRELSLAYSYDPDFTPGEFNGVPYDFVMRNIHGNHIAIVEQGRAGADVVVSDSAENLKKGGFMSIVKRFFGARDEMPERLGEDEDKNAKIRALVEQMSDVLPEEELKKFEDSLVDLAYSEATGDDDLDEADAYKFGEREEIEKEEAEEDADDSDISEAVAAGEKHERDKLMEEHIREAARDSMKNCGFDGYDERSQQRTDDYTKGFAEGVKYGEKLEKSEPKKLDSEHESEGEKRALAHDAALRLEKSIAQRFHAAREVEHVAGILNPMAFDSADAIYQHALREMGRSASKTAAKDVYRAVIETKRGIAMDSIRPAQKSYTGAFEGLNNIKGA